MRKLGLSLLLLRGLTLAAPAMAQSSMPTDKIQIGIDVIRTFCGTADSKRTDQKYVGSVEGGIILKRAPGIEAGGSIEYSDSEAHGLAGALEKELSDNALKLSQAQIDCMRPYIDRILDAILGSSKKSSTDNSDSGAMPHTKSKGNIGWLRYTIGPCQRQTEGIVRCDGSMTNTDNSQHGLIALVKQSGGIRNMMLAGYGIATAVDQNSYKYEAVKIVIANQASGDTGQFKTELFPDLNTPFHIFFRGVNNSSASFYKILIPVVVKDNSFELVADDILIEK